MRPDFKPGNNIAMKVPSHEFEKTVSFYQNVLGLQREHLKSLDPLESVVFEFGDKSLWIDNIAGLSQAEIWLEIVSEDIDKARKYLQAQDCVIINEIEPLPANIRGFWLSSPSNIIHLVVE